MKKKITIALIALVIISNLPVFNFISLENYSYSNGDGSFIYNEEGGKGMAYVSCLISYGYFLCRHPDKERGDNRLYRTFTIKPWRFWEWRELIFHSERFGLPYLESKK
jgi:hypothetical protein